MLYTSSADVFTNINTNKKTEEDEEERKEETDQLSSSVLQ